MPFTLKDFPILINKISTLLKQKQELLLEHYIQRTDEAFYLIRSVDDYVDLLGKIGQFDYLTVLKRAELMRLTLNENTFSAVERLYEELNAPNLMIFSDCYYPHSLEILGYGDNKAELAEDMTEIMNASIEPKSSILIGEFPSSKQCFDLSIDESVDYLVFTKKSVYER